MQISSASYGEIYRADCTSSVFLIYIIALCEIDEKEEGKKPLKTTLL